MRDFILLYINGQRHEVRGPEAGMMFADYLRYRRGLTGTKIVCAEGDCGACSVLRLRPMPIASQDIYEPMNSCIVTVAQLDGTSLVTVEALADSEQSAALSCVQQAMVQANGSQCGFCTPGFVVALTGLVERKLQKKENQISDKEAKNGLTGNLCRCTGYQPIVQAATSLVVQQCSSVLSRYYSRSQRAELLAARKKSVHLRTENYGFFAPTEVLAAAKYLVKNKEARLLAAGTDLGVLLNKNKIQIKRVLSLHLVPELYEIKKVKGRRLQVGARVTLSVLRKEVQALIPELARFLDIFASPQIKNVATLVGNVANASPIGDTAPFLLLANTVIYIVGVKGTRKVKLEDFYLGYKKTAVKTGELVSAIEFDIPEADEDLILRKTSQRRDLDISAVNMGLRLQWKNRAALQVGVCRIAAGGVGPWPLRLIKTEKFLLGKSLSSDILEQAILILHEEITPLSDLRGSSAFRRVLLENYLRHFFQVKMNHGESLKRGASLKRRPESEL